MPFGLMNSGCTFQCVVRENNLTVNLEKCTLAQPTLTFFGHMVDSEGIRPLPEKVSAIRQEFTITKEMILAINEVT